MTADPSPLFTIITVCRNAEATIGAALGSLARQTFQDWEWIMVDGDSADDTVARGSILAGKGRRHQVISEPDSGIYNAMNKGLRAARGKYVHFLNADDSYCDERVLEDVAAELQRSPRADFIYGNIIVTSREKPDVLHRPPHPEGALAEMVCGCLPHQGSFFRLGLFFDEIGLFNEQLRVAADYQWMMRAVCHPGVRLHYLDRPIANFSADGASSLLEESVPEFFKVLNEDETFQKALGLSGLLAAYQRQVLTLRLQLQEARRRNAHLVKERDRAKAKFAEARENRDKLRVKLEEAKRPRTRGWLPRWMRF